MGFTLVSRSLGGLAVPYCLYMSAGVLFPRQRWAILAMRKVCKEKVKGISLPRVLHDGRPLSKDPSTPHNGFLKQDKASRTNKHTLASFRAIFSFAACVISPSAPISAGAPSSSSSDPSCADSVASDVLGRLAGVLLGPAGDGEDDRLSVAVASLLMFDTKARQGIVRQGVCQG